MSNGARGRTYTAGVKVLLFSNSDADGAFTGGVGWGTLLSEPGEPPLEVTSVGFFPASPSAATYAARKVKQEQPDAVIFPIGTYAFTIGYVEFRIQRLLGRRAAAWYKRMEMHFDRTTRAPGAAPGGLNGFARTLLRRTIGAEPAVSRAEATANVAATLDALSQFEDTTVIVATRYPGIGQNARQPTAKYRTLFLNEVTAMANAHRFPVVDIEQVLAGPGPLERHFLDDVHLSPSGHRLLAAAIREAIANSA